MLHPIPENLIALNGGKLEKIPPPPPTIIIIKKNQKDNLGIKSDFNLIQAPFGPIYFRK